MNARVITFIIMLAVVLGATIGLFVLLAPEVKTSLFYTNITVVLIAELLLMGGLGTFVGAPRLFNVSNVAVVYVINVYAVSLLVVAAIFGLLLGDTIEMTWYYVVLIVVTILASILIGVTNIGASAQKETNAVYEQKAALKNDFAPLARSLNTKLNNTLSKIDVPFKAKEEARLRLTGFVDVVTKFPILKVNDPACYDALLTQTNMVSAKIETVCDEASLSDLKEFISESRAKVEIFK